MESIRGKSMLFAILFSILSILLIIFYVNQNTQPVVNKPGQNAFVATKALPIDHLITEQDIKKVIMPAEAILAEGSTKQEDILGKYVKQEILAGEQFAKKRLYMEKDERFSIKIPNGKRAVSINVNEVSSVSNLISISDYVDVIVSFEKDEAEQLPRQTATIIKNVQVISVGTNTKNEDKKSKELPKTLTLAVNIGDVDRLTFASDFGTIRLALRKLGEKDNDWTGVLNRKQLLY